jgi:hypothetical protein
MSTGSAADLWEAQLQPAGLIVLAPQPDHDWSGDQWEYITHVGGKRAEVGVNGPARRQ